jgi:hypothetical protein
MRDDGKKIYMKPLLYTIALLITSLLLSQSEARAQAGRRLRPSEGAPVNGPIQNPAATTPAAQRGQSTVRGRVVYEDNGRPAKRARVLLSATGIESDDFPPREAEMLTNEQGEFHFDNLPAGRYRILVVNERRTTLPNAAAVQLPIPGLTGELDPDKGLPDENESEPTVVEVDGANSTDVTLRVQRPGSISGRVLRAGGEPQAGAQVNFVHRKESQGRVVGVYRRSALTDATGAYRISLPPGSYIVSATADNASAKPGRVTSAGFPANTLAVTYYPAATSPRSSTQVRVESGGEASGIDIRLVDRPTHKISGRAAARRDGQPLAGLSVSIVPDDGSGMSLGARIEGKTVETDSDGRWTIKDVPDGEYIVEVGPGVRMRGIPSGPGGPIGPRPVPGGPASGGGRVPMGGRGVVVFGTPTVGGAMRRVVPKKQPVVVAGADVSGVDVLLSEGGRASGTIVTEDGSPVPAETVIIQLPRDPNAPDRAAPSSNKASTDEPPDIEAPRPRQIPRPTPVRPDGSFDVAIVPFGKVRLAVDLPDRKYYVKAMLLNGTDLLREPQEFDGESDVTGLRIILASDSMTLTGKVSQSSGAPEAGAHVVLVPVEPERRRAGGRLFSRTDAQGTYSITGAPGEYFVYVIPQGGHSVPVKLRETDAPPAKAQRVQLQPNERRSVDIITAG